MRRDYSLIAALFALFAGALCFLFLWYSPGINILLFFGMLSFGLIGFSYYKGEKKKSRELLPMAVIITLIALIPLYRTNWFYVLLVFILLPIIYYLLFTLKYEQLKRIGLIQLILLPFLFVLAWLYDLVIAIKNFSLKGAKKSVKSGSTKQYVIGLLASLPFLILFLILFSSADAVFLKYFKDFIDIQGLGDLIQRFFDNDDLITYFYRFITSTIMTVYFFAVYHAIFRGEGGWIQVEDKIEGFVGRIKSNWSSKTLGTFLLPINILFGLFVIVQLRYFFGGEDSIVGIEDSLGYTYSEYARRGFIELIIVSFIVFLLIALVQSKVDLKEKVRHNWFKINSALVLLFTLIIGSSALSRLNLLTETYGLTNLRLFGYAVIIAIIILIPAVIYAIIKEKKIWWFNKAYALTGVVVILLLAVVPTDLVVGRYNINRYKETGLIDLHYLYTLTAEAQVYIAPYLMSDQLPEAGESISTLFYSEVYSETSEAPNHWQSFNISRFRFNNTLEDKFGADQSQAVYSDQIKDQISVLYRNYAELIEHGELDEAYEIYWSETTKRSDLYDLEEASIVRFQPELAEMYEDWLVDLLNISLLQPSDALIGVPIDLNITYDGRDFLCEDTRLILRIENGELKIIESDILNIGYPYYYDGPVEYRPLIEILPDGVDDSNRLEVELYNSCTELN